MLQLPHPVLRRLPSEVVDAALIVAGVAYGLSERFDVMLAPMSQDAAFRTFQVELKRPYMLMWDADDTLRFPVGCLIQDKEDRFFIVSAPTVPHVFGNSADNCTTVCDWLEVEPSAFERTHGDSLGGARGSSNKVLSIIGEGHGL